MNNDLIITELTLLPGRIKDCAENVMEKSLQLEHIRNRIAEIKNLVMDEVASEKVGEKAKYSNAESRHSAQMLKLNNNAEFEDKQIEFASIDRELRIAQIELDHVQNKFKAMRSIASILGNNG